MTEHAAWVESRTCGIEEEQNSQQDEPQNPACQQEPTEVSTRRSVTPDDGRVLTTLDRFRHSLDMETAVMAAHRDYPVEEADRNAEKEA